MAQQLDTTTLVLIGVGGYLAYAYYEKLWPFNVTVTPAPVDPNAAAKAAAAAAALAAAAQKNTGYTSTTTSTNTGGGSGAPSTEPAIGSTAVVNGVTMQYQGNGKWTQLTPAPTVHTCPDVMTWNDAEGACVCPPGMLLAANSQTCVAPQMQTTMQKMSAAAGVSELSTDEWCYYYTQISGNACPIDPGTIDPTGYNAVGAVLTDGSPGDRTTPITISQWYQLMQNQVAGFSLSGLGMFVPAFAGGGIGSPWLL